MSAAEALRDLLPGEAETLFLRACLAREDLGARAWRQWVGAIGDPAEAIRRGGGQTRSLVPLLAHALARAEVEPQEAGLRDVLRASALRERERGISMSAATAGALEALRGAAVDATVLAGVTVGELAFPAPGLRHSHDIDMLIPAGRRAVAVAALEERGGLAGGRFGGPGSTVVGHPLGAPVGLHTRLFSMPGIDPPQEAIVGRRSSVSIGGAEARILAPDDLLVYLIVRGLCEGPVGGLKWPVDAWFALQRWPDLDWDRLRATAAGMRITPVIAVGLEYLTARFDAPVPDAELAAIERAARSAGWRERDMVLVASLRRRRAHGPWLARAAAPRSALALLRWSPSYLRARLAAPS